MSGSEVRLPSTTHESSLNTSSSATEFAFSIPDTSSYFEVWLQEVKTSPKDLLQSFGRDVCDHRSLGEFRFEGTLRVEGYAMGPLYSPTGTLILSEGAEVESNIVVATAIIDGVLHGDIHAKKRVELGRTARVFGDIETATLSIQQGALFEGRCRFLPAPREAHAEEETHSADQGQETKVLAAAAGR